MTLKTVTNQKILIFDIEQAPMLFYGWRTRADYIGHYMVKERPFIMSWSAKWYQKDKMYSDTVTPEEARNRDDSRIIASLADMVREADVVIGHNVDSHDLAILRGRVLIHNLDPLPPAIRSVDTLKIAKRDLGLPYNGMEPLCELAGIPMGKKIGMDGWKKALAGDRKSLKALREYNRADVVSSEMLFDWMRPHVRRLTRLVDGPGHICPSCGSPDLQKRGITRTQVSAFQQWQCNNCKRYSRSKSLAEKRLPMHPL